MSTTTITSSGTLPTLPSGDNAVITGSGVTVSAINTALGGSNVITAENGATFFYDQPGSLLLSAETFVAGTGGTIEFGPNATNGALLSVDMSEFGGTGGTIAFASGDSHANEEAFLGQVTGFSVGDSIEFLGKSLTSVNVVQHPGLLGSSTELDFVGAGGKTIATFSMAYDPTLTASDFSVGPNGTVTYVTCYCEGTRIATEVGEVSVEDLVIGDLVRTASGAWRPIRWIGRRRYAAAFVAGKRHVLPITIVAGALADGVPARDLRVSPEHALYIDGVLVPARHLINGVSIRQPEVEGDVAYYHVELDDHDILLAEGAPAESYVEDGDRGIFENAAEWAEEHGAVSAEAVYCAERVRRGPRLDAIRRRIDRRAGCRGDDTSDPGLQLMADGIVIAPNAIEDGRYRFALAAPARRLVLVSRNGVAESDEMRRLGVAVSDIWCNGMQIDLGWLKADGWHDIEGDAERQWRWTDGAGELPSAGVVLVEVTLCGVLRYRVHEMADALAA